MVDYAAEGYLTDLTYPESFLRELSPVWLNYVAALNGVAACDLSTPFHYLELGCGQGQTTLVNAAAFPHANFHACDLNPAHIGAAQQRAAEFAIDNLQFHHASFSALLQQNLPSFDFIVLHGVYSWVDAEARAALLQILAAKLRSGGLVYVSYNCLPGWASEAPLRKLLVELAASECGDSARRSARALQTLLQLSTGKLQFLATNPLAKSALDAYQSERLDYLVHEFMNRSWELFYGVDVAETLAGVGLEYLGSATLAENHPMLLMDESTANAIAALPSERQRRLATDYATNQRFRRDVFIRGSCQRSNAQIAQQLAQTLIGCVRRRELAQPSIRVPRGELKLQADFMHALTEALWQGPISIAQVVDALHRPNRDAAGIMRNLLFLIAGGTLQPCAMSAPAITSSAALRYTTPTLQAMANRALEGGHGAVLPSRVLGNGIKLQALESLAVAGSMAGHRDAVALSGWLEQELRRRNLALQPDQSVSALASQVIDELLPGLLDFGILS